MSSILEALKELESDKARAAKKTTSVVDVPSTPPRSRTPFFVLGGVLAIGIVAFGVHRWTAPGRVEQAATPVAPDVAAPVSEPPPARGPDWLQRAEAPRARVAPPPSAAPVPVAAAPAPTERAVATVATERAAVPPATTPAVAPPPAVAAPPAITPPAPPAAMPATSPPPAAKPAPARAPSGGVHQVQMEALAFSSHVGERTVTLLVNGTRATLHQGESLGGVEVQLIMADGAYLQRGGDVFFIGKPR